MEAAASPVTPTTQLGKALSTQINVVAPDLTPNEWGGVNQRHEFPGVQRQGDKKVVAFVSEVNLIPGLALTGYFITGQDNTLYVQPTDIYWHSWGLDKQKVDEPFFKVEVVGLATTRQVTRKVRDNNWFHRQPDRTETGLDTYQVETWRMKGWHKHDQHHHRDSSPVLPWLLVPVKVTHLETGSEGVVTLRVQAPDAGVVDVSRYMGQTDIVITNDFFGYEAKREFHCQQWKDFQHLLTSPAYKRVQSVDALWTWWLSAIKSPTNPSAVPMDAVKSLWTRKAIKPNLDRLATDEPLLFRFLLWLHDKKTVDSTSNNKLLAAFLKENGEDYEALRKALRAALEGAGTTGVYSSKSYSADVPHRNICLTLPGADERERERRETKEWNFRKGAKGQAEGLGLDPARHPLTLAAIEAGKIPLSIFHEPGDELHLINIEFDLWEKALAQPGWAEPLYEVAQAASKRGTYSKRVISYIAFLFHLPKYLDRNAPRPGGKKAGWRCMPKFVQSQWQLEMDEATDEGTVKRRSALTPVADNETGVVDVPYVAMAVHGRMTTYCYADQYIVAEEGLNDTIGNGVFVHDVEEKLNGRDDYGLMWYTFIGTDRNTGYPSFLIIFERLASRGTGATRVHFHRVRPCRSKDGKPTPTSHLVEECYRYMAGNVRAEEITAQQGDMIFLKVDGPGKALDEEGSKPVAAFENHRFVALGDSAPPVTLVRSEAKHPANRLGYLYSEAGFRVEHPEHETIPKLEPGWFECRRCKSWEANPVAVWSYTID